MIDATHLTFFVAFLMNTSGVLIVVTMAVLGLWDLYAATFLGVRATVSWTIHETGRQYPTLVLSIGVLVGHFFAGMSGRN